MVSGVNEGANLSDDILYSGTIAAAIEGRFLKYPSVAISAVELSHDTFRQSAHLAAILLDQTSNTPELKGLTFSVNVPPQKGRKICNLVRADFHRRSGVPRTSSVKPCEVGEFVSIPLPVPREDENAPMDSDVGIVLQGAASLSVHDGFSEIRSNDLPLSELINAVNSILRAASAR